MATMKWFGVFLLASLVAGTPTPLFAVDEQRQAYDKMVEEATREADEYTEEKKIEQAEAAEKRKSHSSNAADPRVEKERQRIEVEMQKLSERGLGPDFTEGMRSAKLQELQTQLDRLNRDPQAYFGE
ncbi:hypothetical protein DSCW_58790 [Desulfosarcina widdelii]|uniref:DUF4168 domain-containing protein n=1 Tax=Desulfosarcina widdelii TaxID=947919 RepID=A0A5K7Z8W1_9BACT|nr:hypothetical protein [Desulfosarcina widdelii]BBO78462.1 hypothetical protein DSCW_58790 [Desulfosarcina widdelii]